MLGNAKFEEKVSAALAFAVVSMVPYTFTILLFKDVPSATRDIVMMLVGAVVANATTAIQHRFGTNPASMRKDATIETLANTASSAQAALAPIGPPVEAIPIAPGEVKTIQGTPNETDVQS